MRDVINQTARKIPAWVIYIVGALAAAWLIWSAASGASGPDPVKALEKGLGERGLQVLIATLVISPLRWWGINLLKFRRALGLVGFGFIALHFTAWIALDMGLRWSEVLHDLYKRPYIIVGAFVIGMLLTPPDVISQTLLAVPMWLLFELGVFVSRLLLRRKAEARAAHPSGPQ